MIKVKWFDTYEARETYFRKHVTGLIPAAHLGVRRFWGDFTTITAQDVTASMQRRIACITAFPQDGLAFATPKQVIRAAGMGQPDAARLESRALEIFRLEALQDQALRTLSGGETVRLALAKAWLNASTHQSLAIASPYSWLDRHNAGLTRQTAEAYLERAKPVTYLALKGEDTDMSGSETVLSQKHAALSPLRFEISAQNLRIRLNQSFSFGSKPLWAGVSNFAAELTSPCLITGENGAGKSLFARALAKIVGYRGEINVHSDANQGPCRVLLQNTLSQSLFRIKEQFAPAPLGAVLSEFDNLRDELLHMLGEDAAKAIKPQSILGVKIALCAARLCGNPKLLVLDEPEWGLNYNDSLAFVKGVCVLAHRRKIPVMLVSHKNWWQKMAQSCINVNKQLSFDKPARGIVFVMTLEAGLC